MIYLQKIKQVISVLCVLIFFFCYQPIGFCDELIVEQQAETINNTINEGDNAETLIAGTVIGGVGGGLGSVAIVSASGSVAGLSAAGISSGLATVGGVVGGGMASGLIVAAALPVFSAAAVGVTGYTIYKQAKHHLRKNK